jgi:BirA family transcriptional regulator, biotin operon repressor / biotin---[acetyl-CoA-carboxylase] ligase
MQRPGPCSDVKLAPETEAAGYRVLSLGATESTNDDCVRAARDGDPGRLWIVAAEQTAGRGRHGRVWVSPPGNLYASLLLVDPCGLALAPQLGFVAGLALHQAVETVTGVAMPRLSLKWPNDLLLDGAKVSGLLLEGHRIAPGGTLAIVIGFGLNVAFAPSGTPYPAGSLQDVAPGVTAESFFPVLADAFARSFGAWQHAAHLSTAGAFGAIRTQWLDRAAGLGADVAVRLSTGERTGLFEGLDELGRLQLRTPTGLELIDAGDLYFRNFRGADDAAASMRF